MLPPQPPGRALGTFLGLQLGMGLQRTDTRLAFDPTLGCSVPMAYAGALPGLRCSRMRHSADLGLVQAPSPHACTLPHSRSTAVALLL